MTNQQDMSFHDKVDGRIPAPVSAISWFIHVYTIVDRVSTCFNHPFGSEHPQYPRDNVWSYMENLVHQQKKHEVFRVGTTFLSCGSVGFGAATQRKSMKIPMFVQYPYAIAPL